MFISIAKAEAYRMASKAINTAVKEETGTVHYEDIINCVYNKKGDQIVMMQPNINHINNFTSKVSLNIENKLENIDERIIKVPLFKIFGIELLAGLGPDLKAKIVPIGYTKPPKIKDYFTSAGINQTRHKIYLDVTVEVELIVPFQNKTLTIPAEVPVTEVVILGRVPEIYVGIDGDGEGLSGILGDNKYFNTGE